MLGSELDAGALVLGSALELGLPEGLTTCQVPPKPLKFWPLTSPEALSSANQYRGRPLIVTCSSPLERLNQPTLPCTPEPRLIFSLVEETVSGGQNFRHSALLHSRCLAVSGESTYSVWPLETRMCSPSFELEDCSIETLLEANAIAAASAATSARAAEMTAARFASRRGTAALCLSLWV